MTLVRNPDFQYQRSYPKISSYLTTYNCKEGDYPFKESILSTLGFSEECVVVDGCSVDGTYEDLLKLAEQDSRIKVYQNEFDWSEPGSDGSQKAFARALCENEFLFQLDCDEVVHEEDYNKIRLLTKKFPKNVDILHLPVVELFGNKNECTLRRNMWKWRLSRNKPEITHGIQKEARLVNEKTGKTYSKEGMSDGCFYVNVMNYEMLPHTGFWNNDFEMARQHSPEQFSEAMNGVFERLPSIWHYSWYNLPRKIKQLKKGGVWDRMWGLLYQKEGMERFPGVETDQQILDLADKLYRLGGEDCDQVKGKFLVNKKHPAIMKEWLDKNK